MYAAARAYMSEVYEYHMANVSGIDGVSMWLNDWHSILWYIRGFNPVIKCDYITNNFFYETGGGGPLHIFFDKKYRGYIQSKGEELI
jgi:hypothetical protein